MTDWLDWFFFGCGVVAVGVIIYLIYDFINLMGRSK